MSKPTQAKYKNLFVIYITSILVLVALWFLGPKAEQSPSIYSGIITLKPASERYSSHHAMNIEYKGKLTSFMILLKSPSIQAEVEANTGKEVKVSGNLYFNEPSDFNKIEILSFQ